MKRPEQRVLIAGIGNVFRGDDAFGVEVIRQLLAQYAIPATVHIEDFGTRGYDLAYAISDAYEAVVLVDAVPLGDAPGTLYHLQLDTQGLGDEPSPASPDAHSLDPVSVLRLVRALGGAASLGSLQLVGCEPALLDCQDGAMELSAPVAAAVPRAIGMVRSCLACQFAIHLQPQSSPRPGPIGAAT